MWDAFTGYLKYLYTSYDLLAMVLELCLIGFVVFSVMRFLRGTGGEKLFRGVLFILLAVWGIGQLARKLNLDLERIELLFKYFLGAVLVVAVIAFQPELRRGLMRLGGTRVGRGSASDTSEVIEQVVDAAAYLSKTQIGAILAFERSVGLGDLIAQGTRMNAIVSSYLLNTIFWPGTPLHDMGVVIRRNRIAAAGVQFPLAEHGEYDRTLGSRHRAAIGLSKETDAVVVVISEETGQIGLATDGKLTRFLTLEQLSRQLQETLLPAADRKSGALAIKARKKGKSATEADSAGQPHKQAQTTGTQSKVGQENVKKDPVDAQEPVTTVDRVESPHHA